MRIELQRDQVLQVAVVHVHQDVAEQTMHVFGYPPEVARKVVSWLW